MSAMHLKTSKPSIDDVLHSAPWVSLETHLDTLHERVDGSIQTAQKLREQFRAELLASRPEILQQIRRPSGGSFSKAEQTFRRGIVAAADGTIAPVPLLGGTKIQIGVVLVSNRGDVVDLVMRVFETELSLVASTAGQFF